MVQVLFTEMIPYKPDKMFKIALQCRTLELKKGGKKPQPTNI